MRCLPFELSEQKDTEQAELSFFIVVVKIDETMFFHTFFFPKIESTSCVSVSG